MTRAALALAVTLPLAAQQPGIEVQAYPAGVIAQARLSVPLAPRWGLEIAPGVNLTDRRDWGVHLDEQGWGPGVSLGVRYAPQATGAWVGVRNALWSLAIDWRDLPTQPQGTTDVLVWQPTVHIGWRWALGRVLLDALAGGGREVNVRTRGQPVGAGWIGLAGVALAWGS